MPKREILDLAIMHADADSANGFPPCRLGISTIAPASRLDAKAP